MFGAMHRRRGRSVRRSNPSYRRLAKDFEKLAETLATFVTLASMQLALRRFARAYIVNSTRHRLGMHDDRAPQTPRGPAAEAERPLSVQSRELRQNARERAGRADGLNRSRGNW